MALMIKRAEKNYLPNLSDFSDKFTEVIMKTDDGKEYLFLHILSKRFTSKEEKISFFKLAKTCVVGTCPEQITKINNGPKMEVTLMFVKEI